MAGEFAADETGKASPPSDARDLIVDASMRLAALHPWEEVTISQICRESDVSLATFRAAFPSKGAILGAFSRRIDLLVLDHSSQPLADETAKDRLFDVLMRRLDAMQPYRDAVGSILAGMRSDPVDGLSMINVVTQSMRFMMEAANVAASGPVGAIRSRGLALAWLRLLPVWLADREADQAKTMAALDRMLERGDRCVSRLDELRRTTRPFRNLARAILKGPARAAGRTRERWQPEAPAGEAEAF